MSELINSLSEAEIVAIEAEVAHLPDRKSAAIDAMKIVQEKRGWVSDESLAAIAKQLAMSYAELDGIATFYNLIFRKPVGEQVILFCDSVSCWLMDGDKICTKLQETLKVQYGETTADGRYTLLPVTCLGDCDHAPAMMVGETLHNNLTEADIEAIFK